MQAWIRSGPLLLCVIGSLAIAAAPAGESTVIFDNHTIQQFRTDIFKDGKKVPCGTAELVDGRDGKAVKFNFVEGALAGYMVIRFKETPAFNQSEGFSFWVKGDGSKHFGGIEWVDRKDDKLRYGYCFPLDSTEWKQIVVPWSDVTPELNGPLIGKDGYRPGDFGDFNFGKWYYWRDYPAVSLTVGEVALETKIQTPATNPVDSGMKKLADKLRKHEPITIVTMGDSLTDARHWSNEKTSWPRMFAKDLKAEYGSEVNIVDPAISGTTLSQNVVLMPTWSAEAPAPDLVTVWFGSNDYDAGVRPPRFTEYLKLAIDRIHRQCGGSAAIVLMTTNPLHDKWNTLDDMAKAVREVAKDQQTGLGDVNAEFHKVSADEAMSQHYFAWDKIHLGEKGQQIAADTVRKAIEAQVNSTPAGQ